ncbi:DUF927 domain-containing protein [Humitalea sp. 24SJ18S-53]|uniref:DUF927 domain-containing protein n=1 Tax=Humitalea sp. 24SJ18S-53 TaxID=3422307 RepID=UPI003D671A41
MTDKPPPKPTPARLAIIGAPAAPPPGDDNPPSHTEVPAFEMRADGLFRTTFDGNGKPKGEQMVSGPFGVRASTRDEDNEGWGLLLDWADRDGTPHRWICPMATINGEGSELRSRLSAGGLFVSPQPAAKAALAEFLARQQPPRRVRTTPRSGWYFGTSGGAVFALPNAVVGQLPKEEVMQERPDTATAPVYRHVGTLEAWRAAVAAPCLGNRLLLLAASTAFAAPLLTLLGEPGGGVHLVGKSRAGKSTLLRIAASVWGPPAGPNAFARSWRATGNAMEAVAAEHNDGLLPLDEIGEMEAREVGPTAYALANGTGKARAQRNGMAKPPLTWRVLLLSTGELRIADAIAAAGGRQAAGQEVRLIDLDADAGADMGAFEVLHGYDRAATLAEALNAAAAAQHGTAGRAFLAWLVPMVATRRDWAAEAAALRIIDFLAAFLPPAADGQCRTVARRFAIIAIGGELATKAGVTGWPKDAAWEAAGACFRAWLEQRGGTGAREDMAAVDLARAFLERHGQSRFEVWKDRRPDSEQAERSEAPHESRAVPNRAGWRRWIGDEAVTGGGFWRFYFTREGFIECLGTLNRSAAAKALHAAGYLTPGAPKKDGRAVWTKTAKPPGHPDGVACFWVHGVIMAGPQDPPDDD